jgi:hypothetical protein
MKTSQLPQIVWYDDNPEQIQNYAYILSNQEEHPVKVHVVTKHDAVLDYSQNGIDYFLLDVRDENDDRDGIALSRSIRSINATVPILFITQFFNLYRRSLKEVAPKELIIKKTELSGEFLKKFIESVCSLASLHFKFRQTGLYKMPYETYVKRKDKFELARLHWKLNKHWIPHYLGFNKKAWLAISGKEIIRSDSVMKSFPTQEEIKKLSKSYKAMVFVYRSPYISEEGSVSPDLRLGFYPKLNFKLQSTEGYGHFDTGSNFSFISAKGINFPDAPSLQTDEFLNEEFEFVVTHMPIDIRGTAKSHGKQIPHHRLQMGLVLDWEDSPFIKIDKNRSALFGRDLLEQIPEDILLQKQEQRNIKSINTILVNKGWENKKE